MQPFQKVCGSAEFELGTLRTGNLELGISLRAQEPTLALPPLSPLSPFHLLTFTPLNHSPFPLFFEIAVRLDKQVPVNLVI